MHDGQPDESKTNRCQNDCPEGAFKTIIIITGGSGRGCGSASEVEVS